MDSIGNKETGTKTTDSNPKTKVDTKELEHALNILAKYGIIPDLKEIQAKTGVKMKTHIIARVRGKDDKIKKTYEYENGELLEEK